MNPVFFRGCVERDHAVPIAQQRVHGLRIRLPVLADEGGALSATLSLRFGGGHRLEAFDCSGLGIENAGELVVPALLFLFGGVNLSGGGPDACRPS